MAPPATPSKAFGPVARRFVHHWGEMGTRWGINRTVARVHALLYVSARPIPADEISELLDVARSNVSTSLKELMGWRIVRLVHVDGDRRDHFESLGDVWEMFRIILEERKRREVDPTLVVLRECLAEASAAGSGEAASRERIAKMLEFFETSEASYRQLSGMPLTALRKVFALGRGLRRLVGGKGKP
jgi:DNA-binding transcriptional regulator GbsR (MarR family)